MEARLTTFFNNVAGTTDAFARAYRLLNVLRNRYPELASRFNVSAASPGWKVTYITAPSEDPQDTIVDVQNAAHFSEGFRVALEETI
jgi:hypothetical protein